MQFFLGLSSLYFNMAISTYTRCRRRQADLNRPVSGGSKGGGGGAVPSLFWIFFFLQKRSLLTKISIFKNEYEICLKKLEMAILDTQIFKNFWGVGGYAPRPPYLIMSCRCRYLVNLATSSVSVSNTLVFKACVCFYIITIICI